MFEVTPEYIKKVVSKGQDAQRHRYYNMAVDHCTDMAVHISGTSPEKLLKEARPNEPEDVREYREQAWKPITKSKSKKVISVINRIFNPRMYSVKIGAKPKNLIDDSETLDKYLFENYPFYLSVMTFIKEVFTKRVMEDPNAVLVVRPLQQMDQLKYIRPVPVIYSSKQLLDFEPDKYYVIDITEYKNTPYVKEQIKELLIVDDTGFYIYDRDGSMDEERSFTHALGRTPAFRLGGVITGDDYPYFYESYIAGVLPHWDKAIQIQSDLDAQIVLHAYLEKWEFDSVQCPDCEGQGVVYDPGDQAKHREGGQHQCHRCGGAGKIAKNPFDIYTVNHDAFGPDSPPPVPPAGYIDKPIDILDKLRDEVNLNISQGYSAINMEVVENVPEIQSGIAKTIDRQDLDSFLLQYSNHIFDYVLPNIINFTIQWRYVPHLIGAIGDYGYTITKPVRFDVLSIQHLMAEFAQAREAKLDNNVIAAYEIDIIEKLFSGTQKEKSKVIIRLDKYTG